MKVRVVGIFVTVDNREESWAAAIDPSGSVLDHLQLPFQRDMKAKKLKVCSVAREVSRREKFAVDVVAGLVFCS